MTTPKYLQALARYVEACNIDPNSRLTWCILCFRSWLCSWQYLHSSLLSIYPQTVLIGSGISHGCRWFVLFIMTHRPLVFKWDYPPRCLLGRLQVSTMTKSTGCTQVAIRWSRWELANHFSISPMPFKSDRICTSCIFSWAFEVTYLTLISLLYLYIIILVLIIRLLGLQSTMHLLAKTNTFIIFTMYRSCQK